MILDEEVIKLVKEHFEEDWDENDGWEYSGNFDVFVKFARALYDEGYTKGFKVGHDAGWELNEEVSRRGL
jgi:hypothetical protein